MSSVAYVVVALALAGALASWVAGAYFFVRALSSLGSGREIWYTAAFWMFARNKLQGAAAEDAAKVNKAIVAFIVCAMIAVAAMSIATNLARVAR